MHILIYVDFCSLIKNLINPLVYLTEIFVAKRKKYFHTQNRVISAKSLGLILHYLF